MSTRMIRSIFLVGAFVMSGATTVACAASAQSSQTGVRAQGAPLGAAAFDNVRNRIRFLLDSTKAPSLAVAVAKGGKIIWEEGFGYADVESRTPATPATLYSMAS